MKCINCEKELNSAYSYFNPSKVKYGENPTEYSNNDILCGECSVLLWPCQIDVRFHFGVPQWAVDAIKNPTVFKTIHNGFKKWNCKCTIHYFHRREAETPFWQRQWDEHRGIYGTEPYSYRGWCRGWNGEIIVLVDETETPESLQWITYHELGHLACANLTFVDNAWEKENKLEGRDTYNWKDDAAHEADSEEQFCNRIATAYCDGKLMGRFWWRPRVDAFLKGDPMPDPFVKTEVLPVTENTTDD
jgi:hypothetical protein